MHWVLTHCVAATNTNTRFILFGHSASAFAKAFAPRKTPDSYRDIFTLQKSIKHLALLSAAAERFGSDALA